MMAFQNVHSIDRAGCFEHRAHRLAKVLAQHASDCDDTDSFASQSFAALKEAGFMSALVPTELGGGGATVGEMARAIRILGAACASTALAFAMHSHQVAVAAWRWRHQSAPTDGLLRRIAAEDLVLVSSGGSDWLDSGGTAVACEGGFRVTARKPFASGSPAGDMLMTSAVYDDPAEGPTVLHFSVPLHAPNVRHLDNWRATGMRGTGSQDIALEDVFIPATAISGKRVPGQWHPLFQLICMIAFSLIYSAYLGVADGARQSALDAARRKGEDDFAALSVGEMDETMLTAELAWAEMVTVAETGQPSHATTSRAMALRTLIGRAVVATVERAAQVAGAKSYYRGSPIERAVRDVQAARYHPMASKQQALLTGRVALGWSVG